MDAPMQIPSQQYLVDYMHVQLPIGQGPRSPVAQYQPTQASPTTSRRSSTPPSDGPDYVVPANLSHKKAVRPAMSTLISSRQGLEHEAAGDSEPNVKLESQQQPSSPTPFPGSSQSVLKLTTTKKVAEKKQALACLFCRERKIACGRPDADNEDQTCKSVLNFFCIRLWTVVLTSAVLPHKVNVLVATSFANIRKSLVAVSTSVLAERRRTTMTSTRQAHTPVTNISSTLYASPLMTYLSCIQVIPL